MTATSECPPEQQLLPTVASSLLPDAADDLDADDEDVAGYEAMMSELPSIVSMSGLLDGDEFDELHEIQNLLAPPVSDDDDGAAVAQEPATEEDAYTNEPSHDAYIHSLVPNPIPTSDFFPQEASIALDSDSGYSPPSTADIMERVSTSSYLPINTDNRRISTYDPLKVAASKRVHGQMEEFTPPQVSVSIVTPVAEYEDHSNSPTSVPAQESQKEPWRKRIKLNGIQKKKGKKSVAQTPATVRTSLDGISTPNPLLFGRSIQLPSDASFTKTHNTDTVGRKSASKKGKATKMNLKPRSSSTTTSSKRKSPAKQQRPTLPRPALKSDKKFLVPVPILSYPVPASLADKFKDHNSKAPPLCKVMVKGKMEYTDDAVAPVPAPPQKVSPAALTIGGATPGGAGATTKRNSNSATASKKKASNSTKKKKSQAKSPKKKNTKSKTKKATKVSVAVAGVEGVSGTKSQVADAKTSVVSARLTPSSSSAPKVEQLMVANPLANVPPAEPMKTLTPTAAPCTATEMTDNSTSESPLPVVSSNSSAASITDSAHENDADMLMMMDDSISNSTAAAVKPVKASSSSKPMTPEEKARACRDRNRLHARNTRLRKKAYVEELKTSLNKLVEERDRDMAATQERQAQEEQCRSTCKQVMLDFLHLRGQNERDPAKWERCLEDASAFTLTLPVTTFQSMVHKMPSPTAANTAEEQVLTGVQDVMADASYFASFLQSVGTACTGDESIRNEEASVSFEYSSDDQRIVMDGSTAIMNWRGISSGATSKGAKSELRLNGSIRAKFSPDSSKLVSAIIKFDTGAIRSQLHSHM